MDQAQIDFEWPKIVVLIHALTYDLILWVNLFSFSILKSRSLLTGQR